MKYKIILKTTHKHFLRIERCMKYWLKNQDVVCASDKIINLDIPQLSASDKDTHGVSSEEKTVYMFNHIKNNPSLYQEYDWFIFIDDDAILNVNQLNYILPYLDKSKIYGINMKGAYPKNISLEYPSGGGGYLVSYNTIINNDPMINHHHYHEDVSVGHYMRDNNLELSLIYIKDNKTHNVLMNGWFPLEYKNPELTRNNIVINDENLIASLSENEIENLGNFLTHHYIVSDVLMEYIYNLFMKWKPSLLG